MKSLGKKKKPAAANPQPPPTNQPLRRRRRSGMNPLGLNPPMPSTPLPRRRRRSRVDNRVYTDPTSPFPFRTSSLPPGTTDPFSSPGSPARGAFSQARLDATANQEEEGEVYTPTHRPTRGIPRSNAMYDIAGSAGGNGEDEEEVMGRDEEEGEKEEEVVGQEEEEGQVQGQEQEADPFVVVGSAEVWTGPHRLSPIDED